MTPVYWEKATRALSRNDPTLKKIIRSYAGELLVSRGDIFHTLARSITGQQISVKAADTIWRRMQEGIGHFHPQALLDADVDTLRGYGLSKQKVSYLYHIAAHCLENKAAVKRWPKLEDEALIKELVRLKGVGRWTAEMLLIFHFQRPDVFPIDDLGVLKAISIHYKNRKPVTRAQALALAENWRPYRSVATWYLWRSLDPHPIEY